MGEYQAQRLQEEYLEVQSLNPLQVCFLESVWRNSFHGALTQVLRSYCVVRALYLSQAARDLRNAVGQSRLVGSCGCQGD